MQATFTANVGTPAYMAPELLSTMGRTAQYSAAVDIYAFGIIMNALWRRGSPYRERDFTGVLHLLRAVIEGLRPTISADCPRHMAALMKDCWCDDPASRISAQEVARRLEDEMMKSQDLNDPTVDVDAAIDVLAGGSAELAGGSDAGDSEHASETRHGLLPTADRVGGTETKNRTWTPPSSAALLNSARADHSTVQDLDAALDILDELDLPKARDDMATGAQVM
jgi:serine/threonine protein kinase